MTRHSSRRSPIARALTWLVVVSAVAVTYAPPAVAASYNVVFSGTVVCDSSSDGVQGVWVHSNDGSDGFATWWAYPGRLNAARYSISVTSSRPDPAVRLDIGCGGTTKAWRRNLKTPDFRTRNGYTENRRCTGSHTAANNALVCTPSPQARSVSSNQGDYGYCTYGAYLKWREWTGRSDYPDISGNAKQMDDNARAKGFYVSSVPHVGSMVVFNNADQWGHVGWVTAVRKSGSGVVFDYVDMNGGTYWIDQSTAKTEMFNRWGTKTNKVWDPAIQAFIVAPT